MKNDSNQFFPRTHLYQLHENKFELYTKCTTFVVRLSPPQPLSEFDLSSIFLFFMKTT